MRTNIVLDDDLVRQAFRYSKARTKRELVHEALRELIRLRARKSLLDLKGTGLARRGRAGSVEALLRRRPPKARKGADVLETLLAERAEGR